jgi:hypothetical protein
MAPTAASSSRIGQTPVNVTTTAVFIVSQVRIYKMSYGKPTRTGPADIAKMSLSELVSLFEHKNEFFARHARKRLQELAASGAGLIGSLRHSATSSQD